MMNTCKLGFCVAIWMLCKTEQECMHRYVLNQYIVHKDAV